MSPEAMADPNQGLKENLLDIDRLKQDPSSPEPPLSPYSPPAYASPRKITLDSPDQRRCCRFTRRRCLVALVPTCFCIALLAVGLFMAKKLLLGSAITDVAPDVANTTATEETTGIAFPVHRDPQQVLVGLSVLRNPNPQYHDLVAVAAAATYVEDSDAAKKAFKSATSAESVFQASNISWSFTNVLVFKGKPSWAPAPTFTKLFTGLYGDVAGMVSADNATSSGERQRLVDAYDALKFPSGAVIGSNFTVSWSSTTSEVVFTIGSSPPQVISSAAPLARAMVHTQWGLVDGGLAELLRLLFLGK